MDTILALDLGTKTGWALRNKGITVSGVENFQQSRFQGGGIRYLRFACFLDEMLTLGKIDAVYFEEVRRHLSTDAAHCYGGFLSHLSAWGEHNKIPYFGIPVGTIKKHITGKGNASKQEVIAAIKALGFNPIDDNEADSLALLLFAQQNFKR